MSNKSELYDELMILFLKIILNFKIITIIIESCWNKLLIFPNNFIKWTTQNVFYRDKNIQIVNSTKVQYNVSIVN